MSQIPVTLRDMFWSDPFFETAWGPDFNLLRQEMVREHRLTWDRFGHSFTGEQEQLLERQQQQQLQQCCQHCKKNSYHSATDSIGSSEPEPNPDLTKVMWLKEFFLKLCSTSVNWNVAAQILPFWMIFLNSATVFLKRAKHYLLVLTLKSLP